MTAGDEERGRKVRAVSVLRSSSGSFDFGWRRSAPPYAQDDVFFLPEAELHRARAIEGYTVENTSLICARCHANAEALAKLAIG